MRENNEAHRDFPGLGHKFKDISTEAIQHAEQDLRTADPASSADANVSRGSDTSLGAVGQPAGATHRHSKFFLPRPSSTSSPTPPPRSNLRQTSFASGASSSYHQEHRTQPSFWGTRQITGAPSSSAKTYEPSRGWGPAPWNSVLRTPTSSHSRPYSHTSSPSNSFNAQNFSASGNHCYAQSSSQSQAQDSTGSAEAERPQANERSSQGTAQADTNEQQAWQDRMESQLKDLHRRMDANAKNTLRLNNWILSCFEKTGSVHSRIEASQIFKVLARIQRCAVDQIYSNAAFSGAVQELPKHMDDLAQNMKDLTKQVGGLPTNMQQSEIKHSRTLISTIQNEVKTNAETLTNSFKTETGNFQNAVKQQTDQAFKKLTESAAASVRQIQYGVPTEKWPTLNVGQKMAAKDLVKKKQWKAEDAE